MVSGDENQSRDILTSYLLYRAQNEKMLFITIEQISALISILTPFVLLFWFVYTQKQLFNNEILGLYAGYTEPKEGETPKDWIEGGIIMNVKDIESSGYFRGEFDYRENFASERDSGKFITDGIYTFYGEINYRLFPIKKRNPLKIKTK